MTYPLTVVRLESSFTGTCAVAYTISRSYAYDEKTAHYRMRGYPAFAEAERSESHNANADGQ